MFRIVAISGLIQVERHSPQKLDQPLIGWRGGAGAGLKGAPIFQNGVVAGSYYTGQISWNCFPASFGARVFRLLKG